MKKITFLLCAMLFSVLGFSQGHETFDNLDLDPDSNSYQDGSFTGDDGVSWEYLQSRGDFEINGKALMLGRNRTPDAELKAENLPNGIGTLQFSYMQAFSSDVNLEVYVNDQLVYTATSDDEQNDIKTTEEIEVNVEGSFSLRFYNPDGGQVVLDDIIWTALGDNPTLSITSPTDGQEFAPGMIPDIQFNISNFALSSSANANDGDGYIQYSIDNGAPTDYFSSDPISLGDIDPGSHSVMLELVDNNGDALDPEISASVEFTLNSVNEVNSIAELRNGEMGSYYTLTSEAVLTYQQDFRNQKYIQDDSGAILIDDDSGVITTTYNRYDGITGITGMLTENNGTMELQPTEDSGEATSSGNTIAPVVLSISDYMAEPEIYESQIIAFEDVSFEDADGSAVFEVGTNYNVTDGSNETIMRTNFYDADYIGDIIPEGTQDGLVGIADHFNGEGQFYIRDEDDLNGVPLSVENFGKTTISLYPNPATNSFRINMEGKAQVNVFSLTGKQMISTTVDGKTPINVARLSAGIYLVKIKRDAQVITQKLIVE